MPGSDRVEAIRAELERAVQARRDGNEGMARVCARRAAGWAVSLCFGDRVQAPTQNAYALLGWLSREPSARPELRQAAERLRARITPDHKLPHLEDPIEDALLLVSALTPDVLQAKG